MKENEIKNIFREEIIKKSIGTLRSYGKSDDEIKEILSKNFSQSKEKIDELLNEARTV